MLKFQTVNKAFGKNKVLKGIDIAIEGGEFVSFIGPSGVGKSTIIHLLLGADTVDSGEIWVDQYQISKLKPVELQNYRRKIGVIFQDYKLLPNKTVYENIAYALEVTGYDDKYINEKVTDALTLVGLKRKANAMPHTLSGGEKQRTALARAIIHKPRLILADEPTGNLDPKGTDDLIDLLLKINKSGTTIVLATHNDRIVDKIKKRVIHLEDGKVVSDKAQAGYYN